jgi:hypothetical protein
VRIGRRIDCGSTDRAGDHGRDALLTPAYGRSVCGVCLRGFRSTGRGKAWRRYFSGRGQEMCQ